MLVDRDRLAHLDNLDEIREIQRLCGWSRLIGYLQRIEEAFCPDPELSEALEQVREVARRADERFLGVDDDSEPPRKPKRKR